MKETLIRLEILIIIPLTTLILEKGFNFLVDWDFIWKVEIGTIILMLINFLWKFFRNKTK